jgi:Protein of unknown function (DUF3800)
VSSATIYVDESGDLGWKFDAPYREGGSSRFLTIAALVCPQDKKHLPKRLIRGLYSRFKWDTAKEKKWTDTNQSEKKEFANQADKLLSTGPLFKLLAITVSKENVIERVQRDENKIYNYMIKLLLLDEMTRYETVSLIPDPRSIKGESGNSLHDYLSTEMAFERGAPTILTTHSCDSACSLNLQFTDMCAGLIQSHFEDSHSVHWNILSKHISHKKLFFPR